MTCGRTEKNFFGFLTYFYYDLVSSVFIKSVNYLLNIYRGRVDKFLKRKMT